MKPSQSSVFLVGLIGKLIQQSSSLHVNSGLLSFGQLFKFVTPEKLTRGNLVKIRRQYENNPVF